MNKQEQVLHGGRRKELSSLQDAIGYRFRDLSLLETATTHASFSNEHRQLCHGQCNERLEFLGDSVLSLITGEYLFEKFPEWDEEIGRASCRERV